jgi:hypothetical protein
MIMKRKLILILNIFFIVILFFSNKIVGAILWPGYEILHSVAPMERSGTKVTVDYDLSSFNVREDILDTIVISGSAIAKNENGVIAQDQIRILFESDERTYVLFPIMRDRFDNNKIELVSKGLGNIKHGFTTKTTPINMHNGIYYISLACYHGDVLIGVVDTGATLEISSNDVTVKK